MGAFGQARRAGLLGCGPLILLTVGTQLPFDRLVRAVDEWAACNPGVEIFGQIGITAYRPDHFQTASLVSSIELAALVAKCDLVVSHAGMGSILTAMQFGKPLIIMPRKASLGEIRTDHQLATARRFAGRPGITVAYGAGELLPVLSRRSELSGATGFHPFASDQLISQLNRWLAAKP